MSDLAGAVELALASALRAGAAGADAVAVEADSLETRVRGEEIDFVKQARERKLGVRALVRGAHGTRSAITSTSDLGESALRAIAAEAVALARTAEDPAAALLCRPVPSGLADPGDRGVSRRGADRRGAPRRERRAQGRSAIEVPRRLRRRASRASPTRAVRASRASTRRRPCALCRADRTRQRRHAARLLDDAARSLAALGSPEGRTGRRAAGRCAGSARGVRHCSASDLRPAHRGEPVGGQGLVSGYTVYRGTTYLRASSAKTTRAARDPGRRRGRRAGPAQARRRPGSAVAAHAVIERPARVVPRHLLRAQGRRKSARQRVALTGQRARRRRHQLGRARRASPIAHRRHAARFCDRADRNGLQPHDRRLLARRRGPLDRRRRDRPSRRGGDDRGELRRHAARDRRGRQRPLVAVADRIAVGARRAHDGGGRKSRTASRRRAKSMRIG